MVRRSVSRQRILDAALMLFAQQGYIGTTIEQISASAGVSKGTIFNNFGGKRQLWDTLLDNVVHEVSLAFQPPAHLVGNSRDTLTDTLLEAMRVIDARPQPARLVLQATLTVDSAFDDRGHELRGQLLAPLVGVIARLQDDLPGPPLLTGPQLEHAAAALLAAVVLMVIDRQLFSPARSIEESHATLVIAVNGLADPTMIPVGDPAERPA